MPFCPRCRYRLDGLPSDSKGYVNCPECGGVVLPASSPSQGPSSRRLFAVAIGAQVPFALMWCSVLGSGFGNGWGAMGAAIYGTPALSWGGALVGLLVNLIWSGTRAEPIGRTLGVGFAAAALSGLVAALASITLLFALPWHGC